MDKFVLSDEVRLNNNKILLLADLEVFKCNEDALLLINQMIKFRSEKKSFSIDDLIEALNLEKNDDNLFCITNTINYLRGCFLVNHE